jgi:xanthine dehydrogenase accessory factor
MHHHLDDLVDRLAIEPAILVTVAHASGSVPRDVGTWMAVFREALVGTIGGGHLEWEAIRSARAALVSAPSSLTAVWDHEVVLGPSLGQCCGGRLTLHFERVDASGRFALSDRLAPALTPVALFGGGHVGRAIVRALEPLPFAIQWIDSRDEVFPASLGPNVVAEHSDPVAGAVADLAPGSRVLVMSFSHAEDLDIVLACLERRRVRADLPFVGLIGSRTKWASFSHRLAARGFSASELSGITCPIGLPGIEGKAPEVIAASVAAQLLLVS